MNLADYYDKIDWTKIKRFAENEWVEFYFDNGMLTSQIDYSAIPYDSLSYFAKLEKVDPKLKAAKVQYMFVMNELYRNGPKVIRPTFEQCIVLEQIETRLTVEYYEQPYPTTAVLLPEEYVRYLYRRDGTRVPDLVACYHNREKKYVLMTAVSKGTNAFTTTIYGDSVLDELFVLGTEDVSSYRLMKRVVFNLNMIMVSEGMERIGYENIKRQRHLEREDRRDGGDRRKREFYYIGLKQEIPLFNVKRVSDGPRTDEHRSPRPHWRKGHLRRVESIGKSFSLDRRLFVVSGTEEI